MDMDLDQDKLMDFLHRFVGDLGAAMAAGNVVVGDRLGLYRALAAGPLLRRASWPSAPAPQPATSTSGCAARRPAATSSTTPRPAGTRSPRSRRSR